MDPEFQFLINYRLLVKEGGSLFWFMPIDYFGYEDLAEVIAENELAKAFYDKFPVTDGHVLVVPKRHVTGYFELYQPELNAMNRLMRDLRAKAMEQDSSITGFNIGSNDGADAGQTVMHCHMHLIPRRAGDVNDPRGGVRGVIPGKQKY